MKHTDKQRLDWIQKSREAGGCDFKVMPGGSIFRAVATGYNKNLRAAIDAAMTHQDALDVISALKALSIILALVQLTIALGILALVIRKK